MPLHKIHKFLTTMMHPKIFWIHFHSFHLIITSFPLTLWKKHAITNSPNRGHALSNLRSYSLLGIHQLTFMQCSVVVGFKSQVHKLICPMIPCVTARSECPRFKSSIQCQLIFQNIYVTDRSELSCVQAKKYFTKYSWIWNPS